MSTELFSLWFVIAAVFQTQPPQGPRGPVERTAATAPKIAARIWAVAFDAAMSGDSLPIDPRVLAAPERSGMPARSPDEHGRIPTWGLAVQLQQAKLDVRGNGHRLLMRDGSLVTEADPDARTRAAGPPWKIVAAPMIHMLANQPAEITIGEPVVYLHRQSETCYERRTNADVVEGFSLKLNASKILPDGIRITDISLRVSRVVDREPLEGLGLPVGRPKMSTRETQLNLTLDAGKVAVIPLPQAESEPAILVFLTAEQIDGSSAK